MDRFEVQRMSEQEGDVLGCAEIGQPVPVERRLTADDQVALLIRSEGAEELVWLARGKVAMQRLVSGVIDDADVHGVGVQIDAAVELVLLLVEPHRVFS